MPSRSANWFQKDRKMYSTLFLMGWMVFGRNFIRLILWILSCKTGWTFLHPGTVSSKNAYLCILPPFKRLMWYASVLERFKVALIKVQSVKFKLLLSVHGISQPECLETFRTTEKLVLVWFKAFSTVSCCPSYNSSFSTTFYCARRLIHLKYFFTFK